MNPTQALKYIKILKSRDKESLTLNDIAKIMNIDVNEAKRIIRKLKREGFIRRTKSGRYKLTLASKIILELIKNKTQ